MAPILETIVTTLDGAGRVNCAPMGITLDGPALILRPFKDAATCLNLQAVPEGVVHFTDDVLVFARCALVSAVPPHHPARAVRGVVLDDACHWKEFVVDAADLAAERASFRARVVALGRGRDFAGMSRAKHAVIEATIAATRLHLLGRDQVVRQMEALKTLVDKTAGPQEREAFEFVARYVRDWRAGAGGDAERHAG